MTQESAAVVNQVRDMRAAQPWIRYDSVVVGQGFGNSQIGWYNNFRDFALEESLVFFSTNRTKQAGLEFVNISGDTEDWAQKIYATRIEFGASPGIGQFDADSRDSTLWQYIWKEELTRRMSVAIELADTDNVFQGVPVMMPSNMGTDGSNSDGNASAVNTGAHTGNANLGVGYVWPKPLEVPAKGKITCTLRLGRGLRQLLQSVADGPSVKVIPVVDPQTGQETTVEVPNVFFIRISMWGPRRVQLRGARSS